MNGEYVFDISEFLVDYDVIGVDFIWMLFINNFCWFVLVGNDISKNLIFYIVNK